METNLLYIAAGIFLFIKFIGGWRLGPVRQAIRLLGMGAGYVAWRFNGDAFGHLLRFTGLPDLVLEPLGGALLGLLVYLFVDFVGAFLFSKTTQQRFGPVWLFYGITGGVMGLVLGMLWIGLFSLGLRAGGALAIGTLPPPAPNVAPGAKPEEGPLPLALARDWLAKADRQLRQGIPGAVLNGIDPVSEKTYGALAQFGKIAYQPEAMERFTRHPQVARILERPEVVALARNPEIVKAIREKRYLALLRNPDLVATANREETRKWLRRFELGPILEELARAEASPAATPAPPVGDGAAAAAAPAPAASPSPAVAAPVKAP